VFVLCCVGSGLCDGLITLSEESYRVCVLVCLTVCDLETSRVRRSRSGWAVAPEKGKQSPVLNATGNSLNEDFGFCTPCTEIYWFGRFGRTRCCKMVIFCHQDGDSTSFRNVYRNIKPQLVNINTLIGFNNPDRVCLPRGMN